MCNHYRNNPDIQATLQTWRDYISWSLDPVRETLEPVESDVWPKRTAAVVRNSAGGAQFDVMRWGVPIRLPGKRAGTSVTKQVTNVRNLDSGFWRSMLSQSAARCLVPFSRFAEPAPGGGRREIWFSVSNVPVAAFAAIWRPSESGNCFALLTCAPKPLIAPVHPKAMPVILHPEDYTRWLAGDDAATLATSFPSQLMAVADEV